MSTIWQKGEKTVIVTGGTKGIGYETASGLAARGATVIIVGRDAQRGAAAVNRIQQHTGNAAISFLQADLSSLAEVRRLAEQITSQYSHIHVLVNNAGGVNARRIVTAEGLEATFVTNHLAPFLLTDLLLPILKASTPARIVNVNSIQHRSGRIDFDDLQAERAYDMMCAYQQAKLANLFFTYELARRLRGTNVTVNAADPGGTIEGVKAVPLPLAVRLILPLFSPWLTASHAAQSSLYLASSPDVEALMGKYVNFRKKVVRSSPVSYEEATAEKLWRISAALVDLRGEELVS
ncbi:MAG TPA: SDR family oxidoreductase [Ktedonobacteraceae bacterium]|jgi:NAD(P)-dependent dehydrogenase (short-subunit alcohol dehydrogenase family)|nr:SDR family oxidoreductase [Ktedonobacteraceae bacterium]